MKQRFLNFISINKKYSIAVAYAIIACIILSNRDTIIYSHMPIIQNFPIVVKILDGVFSLLILTGFIALVKILYCPPYLKKRFQLAVERASLHNGKNEFPKLVSVKTDITKAHQKIYKIKNYGLPIQSFDDRISYLEGTLGGQDWTIRALQKSLAYIDVSYAVSLCEAYNNRLRLLPNNSSTEYAYSGKNWKW